VHRVSAQSKHAFAALGSAVPPSARRSLAAAFFSGLLLGILPALPASHATAVHLAAIPTASGGWLDRLNAWRGTAGLSSLTENLNWSQGDYDHAVYMVKNDLVTHYETAGVPYYTTAGDTEARNSNIQVSSTTSTSDQQAIDWWMAAPFHAMAMMDPRLTQTGFGSYRESKSGWQEGAALDTIHGNSFTGGKYPTFFPGNGANEPLTTYAGGEFPDPLQACSGYTAPTGLPVFIEVGGNVSTAVGSVHSFTGNGVALENCAIDSTNPNVSSYLYTRGGVIIVPRQPLQAGVKYVVALTVNGTPYTWSFSVGALATVPGPPAAVTAAGTAASATVTWTPPTDTGSTAIASYTVTPYIASVAQPPQTVSAPATSAVFNGLTNGAAYSFHVAATNSIGTGSAAASNLVIPGWVSLGGTSNSSPGVASSGANAMDVFVRGTDNALWHRSWNGTTWSTWESLGGVLLADPRAVSEGPNHTDVFVIGTDHGIWHRSWNGSAWSAWDSEGGYATSAPAATSWGTGRLDIVVRGTDNGLWHRSWNGAAWAAWDKIGGTATSNPSVVAWGVGRLDVFVSGTDSALWHRSGDGTGMWGAWDSLGGVLTSGPGAASCQSGHLDVFALGSDSGLWQRGYNGTGWAGWQRLGGPWTTDPGAACRPATTTVDLVETASDAALWQGTVTGT
jgi:hypothetical protein